jgi:hypothetical protein
LELFRQQELAKPLLFQLRSTWLLQLPQTKQSLSQQRFLLHQALQLEIQQRLSWHQRQALHSK